MLKNKINFVILSIITFFLLQSFFLFLLKIISFFQSYDLYVTSGVEVSTLNYLYNLLNQNDFYLNNENEILYEIYGYNFHLLYFPIVKLLDLFGISYLISSRLITTLIIFLLGYIILKICDNINLNKSYFADKKYLFYSIVLSFLLYHQLSSWWIITYRPDFLAITLAFFSIYLFLNYIDKENKYLLFFTIFTLVFAWTIKQNFIFGFASIFFYFLYFKKFKEIVLLFSVILISIILLNFLTGFNNFSLLDRSPSIILKNLEYDDYVKKIFIYGVKNSYLLIFLTSFIIFMKDFRKDKKKFFLLLIFIFIFIQSSIVGILKGAGFNHLMLLGIFLLIGIHLIDYNKLTFNLKLIFVILFLPSLILSSIQIYNFNKIGRIYLHYNLEEKNNLENFNTYRKENLKKPILILGAADRYEMLLREDENGIDTHQLVSFFDLKWRAFMYNKLNHQEKFKDTFENKIKKINTVLISNENKYTDRIEYFNKNNFLLVDTITIETYEHVRSLYQLKNFFLKKKGKNKKKLELLVYRK